MKIRVDPYKFFSADDPFTLLLQRLGIVPGLNIATIEALMPDLYTGAKVDKIDVPPSGEHRIVWPISTPAPVSAETNSVTALLASILYGTNLNFTPIEASSGKYITLRYNSRPMKGILEQIQYISYKIAGTNTSTISLSVMHPGTRGVGAGYPVYYVSHATSLSVSVLPVYLPEPLEFNISI
jgi:hypothetical protein